MKKLQTTPKIVNSDSPPASTAAKQGRVLGRVKNPPVLTELTRENQPNLNENMESKDQSNPFNGQHDGHILMENPKLLKPHPDIEKFPELSAEEYQVLKNDILEKGKVLDPLRINSSNQILDGRHRNRIALELDLPTVPVIIDDESNPIEVALRTAIVRRQFTKSMAAFTLFEFYPVLRNGRQAKQKKFLLRSSKNKDAKWEPDKHTDEYDCPTYRDLQVKFNISAPYFTYLAQMWDNYTPEEWERLRRSIFVDGKGIPALYAGFSGEMNTKDLPRRAVEITSLMHRCFRDLQNRAKNWTNMPLETRHKILLEWSATIKALPEEFNAEYQEFLARKEGMNN